MTALVPLEYCEELEIREATMALKAEPQKTKAPFEGLRRLICVRMIAAADR